MSADLNCPFCGSKPTGLIGNFHGVKFDTCRCSNADCLASFKTVDAEVWNRRAPVASAPALTREDKYHLEVADGVLLAAGFIATAAKVRAIIARITGEEE